MWSMEQDTVAELNFERLYQFLVKSQVFSKNAFQRTAQTVSMHGGLNLASTPNML